MAEQHPRDSVPPEYGDHFSSDFAAAQMAKFMSLVGEMKDNFNNLVTLVNECKTDLNAMRADFRGHDHGATYTASACRLSATPDTFSGSAETNTVVAAADAVACTTGKAFKFFSPR